MGTALLHSLAVTEKRGIFKSWTVLLAIAAFSLSLLGTFLVRSGVLISVHAFASDPTRGLFILGLLTVISGGALAIYAVRARLMVAEGGFKLVSRESFLLANNILLVIATGAVLFGTLYPLFLDALGLGKISVGPPYFNLVFLLPMLPLAALLGIGMHAAWKRSNAATFKRRLKWPAILALALGVIAPIVVYGGASVMTVVGLTIGLWVVASALLDPVGRLLRRGQGMSMSRAHWGMVLAHLGVGLFIVGATVTSAYNLETDRSARPGDRWETGGYEFVFRDIREVTGPNFDAFEGEFELRRDGELVAVLTPQKRIYRVQRNPMTEAAIDGRLHRDVFIALGESIGGGAWSLRVQVKPMIRLLWYGAIVMALGGLLAATDRRYRQPARAPQPRADAALGPAEGA
jgi:cytochrome c-type biogenesis protein CcmF